MAYPTYPYPGYPGQFYPQPVPDQLAQLRQNPFQQQPSLQPVPQPQLPPSPPQNSGGGMLWVNSKRDADDWPITAGCAVALWDANSPVIYLRQADSTGKPSTKVYDLVERTDDPPRQAPQIDLSNYITREQLEEILSERLKRPQKAAQKKEDTDNG